MKLYGLRRIEVWADDFAIGRCWTGEQSRKVARRRRKDKKLLHRRARRTAKY